MKKLIACLIRNWLLAWLMITVVVWRVIQKFKIDCKLLCTSQKVAPLQCSCRLLEVVISKWQQCEWVQDVWFHRQSDNMFRFYTQNNFNFTLDSQISYRWNSTLKYGSFFWCCFVTVKLPSTTVYSLTIMSWNLYLQTIWHLSLELAQRLWKVLDNIFLY